MPTATKSPDVRRENVRFEEAIAFLRNKVDVPTEAWTDIWEKMHSVAFVVAGANSEAIVADFHKAINEAIENGTTLATFRREFGSIVKRYGWQYKGSPGWRSRVIFETNLRMAYAAGRWAQIQRLKHVRPYLRYVTMDDDRVRPEHRAWHNIVLHVDDPWWQTHFPPCGWGCRCRVQSLNDRDLKRYGFRVSPKAPEIRYVAKEVRTPDGPIWIDTPVGIDPGFGYNPGAGAFGHGSSQLAIVSHESFRRLHAPGERVPVFDTVAIGQLDFTRSLLTGEGRDSVREAAQLVGELLVTDPLGVVVRVGMEAAAQLMKDQDIREGLSQLPDLISDPEEIWISFVEHAKTGKVQVRRRYLRNRVGEGSVAMELVTDVDGREWSAMFFGEPDLDGTEELRSGVRIFRKLPSTLPE